MRTAQQNAGCFDRAEFSLLFGWALSALLTGRCISRLKCLGVS